MRPLLCLIIALTASAADRPNVLWFIVDDMSANFSCYGEKTIATSPDTLNHQCLLAF